MDRQSDQYPMRFPEGLRDRVKAEAAANHRSMNSEFVARVEASFAPGMSLRDWFAGQALAGLIGAIGPNNTPYTSDPPWLVAGTVYALADAMLAERQKS